MVIFVFEIREKFFVILLPITLYSIFKKKRLRFMILLWNFIWKMYRFSLLFLENRNSIFNLIVNFNWTSLIIMSTLWAVFSCHRAHRTFTTGFCFSLIQIGLNFSFKSKLNNQIINLDFKIITWIAVRVSATIDWASIEYQAINMQYSKTIAPNRGNNSKVFFRRGKSQLKRWQLRW